LSRKKPLSVLHKKQLDNVGAQHVVPLHMVAADFSLRYDIYTQAEVLDADP